MVAALLGVAWLGTFPWIGENCFDQRSYYPDCAIRIVLISAQVACGSLSLFLSLMFYYGCGGEWRYSKSQARTLESLSLSPVYVQCESESL